MIVYWQDNVFAKAGAQTFMMPPVQPLLTTRIGGQEAPGPPGPPTPICKIIIMFREMFKI